jgi:hypothetical protein
MLVWVGHLIPMPPSSKHVCFLDQVTPCNWHCSSSSIQTWWEQNHTTVDHLTLHSYRYCCLILEVLILQGSCTDKVTSSKQQWSRYLDVCRLLDMLLTVVWQCAHLIISWVGLVSHDLAVWARADSGAAAASLACQWLRVPHARGKLWRPGED